MTHLYLYEFMTGQVILPPNYVELQDPLIFLAGPIQGAPDWETYHLNRAGQSGAILFWLAKEAVHVCNRAYAQTTRFELGEWKVKHERDGVTLVVGIEDGFTNAPYLRRRLAQDCPAVPICRSLPETCQQAIRVVLGKGV